MKVEDVLFRSRGGKHTAANFKGGLHIRESQLPGGGGGGQNHPSISADLSSSRQVLIEAARAHMHIEFFIKIN